MSCKVGEVVFLEGCEWGPWGEADRYTEACQNSYLNPHPVPPRTIAARRIAPAMDPIMILVPLGPAQRKEGGGGVRRGTKQHHQKHTSEDSIDTAHQPHPEREKEREGEKERRKKEIEKIPKERE